MSIYSKVLGPGLLLCALAVPARADVTVNGTLNAGEGYSRLATQTISSGFGNSTIGDGTSAGGSELDAAYGSVQNGSLNLFLAGNLENNGNHIDLFISDGRPGQSVLSAPAYGFLSNMNGSVFSPGFQATYVIDLSLSGSTATVDEYSFVTDPTFLDFEGSFDLTSGVGVLNPGGSVFNGFNPNTIGFNNTNSAGVNVNLATPALANAVSTGLEIQIPLSILGDPSPGSQLRFLADINGYTENFLSNQFLPGLPQGTGNLGSGGAFTGPNGGTFNFANRPNEFFTLTIPEPASFGLAGGFVLTLLMKRRSNI